MKTLQGKLQTFTLNSDNAKAGRKYLVTNINYGLFRQYFHTSTYDPFSGTGQQRVAKERHKNKLRDEISNLNYTPQVFNTAVSDLSNVNVDDKGSVTIELSENNKLLILDGGTRFSALEEIRNQTKDPRVVDNLPIPIIVYLDDNHKIDFLNLNAGEHIHRSHILNMLIDNGRVPSEKLEIYKRARSLSQMLHIEESSPIRGKVQFGHVIDDSSLAFTVLCTDHASNIIGSLFGTAKLLDVNEKNDSWFLQYFSELYSLLVESGYTKPKKLLSLPPDGAKTNIHHLLSVCNTIMYYLYLQNMVDRPDTLRDNKTHILDCLRLYDQLVDGDSSRRRRVELTGAFAQKLFAGMDEDPELDTLNIVFHHGIPLGLLTKTKYSGFGVEAPPNEVKKKGIKKSTVPAKIESVSQTIKQSDTDEMWDSD